MIQMRYALLNNLCRNNASTIVNEFAKELKNISGTCMDIGCGPGDITKDILLPALDPKATIIGTDIMENTIEYANKTYADTKRLEFKVLDIQTKELPEKYVSKFDHIFSFHTLHWCYDIRQTFENIYRMLQPGKTILTLSVAHNAVIFEPLEIMVQNPRYAPYMGDKKKYIGSFHYSARPREELTELLENIGFQVHHCSHRKMYNIIDTEEFRSMVTSQYAFKFLDEMPPDLKEEFMIELKRRFIEIEMKEIEEAQRNFELNEKKGTNTPALYTVLVVYAQKKSHNYISS